MRAFPFDHLPRLRARRWLPQDLTADSWEKVAPFFDDLEGREVDTPETLEKWLLDSNELAMALTQEGTGRHVRTTLDTEDPEIATAWRHFAEEVSPKTSPRWHALERKYLASPARKELDRNRWRVYDRDAESGHALFREENIPLGVELSRLDQEYNRLRGAMTASLDGREHTAIQLGQLQESPDRGLRERAWRALWNLYLESEERFEGIYQRMLELRTQIARNAGFDEYRAYAWKSKGRYDYTPQDCLAFHEAIEETVVPLLRKLTAVRRERLGLEVVRPWDVRVDLSGKPALAAVTGTRELCRAMTDILSSVDPELGSLFAAEVVGRGMIDLESRRGKAPGGYQTVFPESGLPFIFNNGAGTDDDLTILAHEAGHAFNSLLSRDEPLLAYRRAPLEFAEVASSAMEFFTYEHMDRLHQDPADLARSRWFRLWRVL
ncbi:MAG: M3 family oligoendopeptidase, partial [Candidatus Riflebacteria bacterium]|nr:M3 family oligoendopeptidase [Candidatus Riflebacteria bacterium]